MPKEVFRVCTLAAALILTGAAAPAIAMEAQSPTAQVVRETHGDWSVGCTTPAQGQPGDKVCTAIQEQTDTQTKQRVIAVELRADGGGAKGVLVLPFGLAVQRDVKLQADDGKPFIITRIRSCLPVGCAVELTFDEAKIAQLGESKALKVNAVVEGGKDVSFAISLKGFQEALTRTQTLAQSTQQDHKS